MIRQLINALLRALIVAALVALPALALPASDSADGTQIVVLVALALGLLVFLEYNSAYPSFIEFRYAPPINRLRFGALAITVAVITGSQFDPAHGSTLGGLAASVSRLVAGWIDLPFSPVRLMVLMLPETAPVDLALRLRDAAGFAYAMGLLVLAVFFVQVQVFGWPARNGAFNVWINLPMFDPTAGGDVVKRLQFHANFNLVLGFLLPFLIPAGIKLASGVINPMVLAEPHQLVWSVSLWAILPVSLMIRGLAMGRIAQMIQQKRDRAYALAAAEGTMHTDAETVQAQ